MFPKFTRLLLCCLLSVSAFAQQSEAPQVLLQSGAVTLERYEDFAAKRGKAAADWSLWLVQWAELQSISTTTLAEAGFTRVGNFSGNVMLLYGANGASFPQLHARFPIKALTAFLPQWKASSEWLATVSGREKIILSFPPNLLPKEIAANLTALGATDVTPGPAKGTLLCYADASQVRKILALPFILSAGPAAHISPLNNDDRGYSGAAVLSQSAATNPQGIGLSGKNVVVGVGDQSSPLTHVDLAEKTTNFHPGIPFNHGTHVSGTIAGSGIIDPQGRGMAPGASLLSIEYDYVLQKTPQFRQSYGMNITNNSYSAIAGQCSNAGVYDIYTQALDQLCRDVPDVLHVFAAGNDGNLQCLPNPGFGNVVGTYQPAKNILVVGNVQKDMKVRTTSSKGPVRDGRLKPEICAFGTSVYSTYINNTYAPTTGTSMASPAIAGAAALLTERYKTLHGNMLPQAVLLKGLLTGCADDLGNFGPDYKYGFGMFNLLRAVDALNQNRYTSRSITPAQTSFSTTISIPAGLSNAKILLVWSDVAAAPSAGRNLINDLDLTVTDPAGNIIRSLVLNPAQPGALAQPGTDTLNNIEQVVISNPIPGSYTVQVSGTSLSGDTVNAVVVYDFVAPGIRLQQPTLGVPVAAGKLLNIFWESPERNGPFTLEYSTDNGGSWNSIGTATDSQRAFAWTVPVLNTEQARVRITRGSDVSDVGPIVINQPPVVTRNASQCPGYFNIDWTAVPNATGYEILQKKGIDMRPVDTVTATTYTLGGLPYGQMQYLAVRPFINGQPGYRSLAVFQSPDTARNCGTFATNDLAIQNVVTPTAGRALTSTAYSVAQQIKIAVRNNGPVDANYQISYRFGNGVRQMSAQKTVLATMADTILLSPQNLSAVGNYAFDAAVVNLSGTDPVRSNDTIKTAFRQLPNAPVNLAMGYKGDFENSPRITLTRDSIGLFDSSRWDYTKRAFGRMRSFIDTTIVINGNRSISLDADRFFVSSQSLFGGTFNLAGFDVQNTEVRAEFKYMEHGLTQYPDSNGAFIRGSDTSAWVPLYVFDTSLQKGVRRTTGSISVTDILRSNGQRLSSSAQVLFMQKDTTVIVTSDYGTGYTVDDLQLYTLGNDIALLRIDSPRASGCGIDPNGRLTVTIANGTYGPQYNVPVSYQLDGGPVFTDFIPFFGAKDTLQHTFPQSLQIRDFAPHRIDVWVSYAPDVYRQNDSLLAFIFQQQTLVENFPYLQNFEAGPGSWYADGSNNSWAWGMPQSPNIKTAASGTKVWKTNLQGSYNNNEKSFLYSPCFDISRMTSPRLSLSLAYDLENCGTMLCDAAFVEWTTDSKTWTRLGLSVEGFNWYDSLQYRAWTGSDQYRWRVATINLPTGQTAPIRLRFGMQSDGGATREGIAVDDIHIYDYEGPVFSGAFAAGEQGIDAAQTAVDFRQDGVIFARINNNGQALGTTTVRDYKQAQSVDSSYTRQLLLPRNFVLQTQNALSDSLSTAFYITDADVLKLLADAALCPECPTAPDAYRLGMLTYTDTSRSTRTTADSSIRNNDFGSTSFRPFSAIMWVPYDSGYIARTKLRNSGEVWFTAGSRPYSYKADDLTLAFDARRKDATTVSLEINAFDDANVARYEIYRSVLGKTPLEKISETTARNLRDTTVYVSEDTPPATDGDTVRYQVQWIGKENGLRFYGPLRQLVWLPDGTFQLYPNPAPDGQFTLQYTAPAYSPLHIRLTDIMGRTLYEDTIIFSGFQNRFMLPVNLRAGVYFLSTELNGKKRLEKVVAL